MINDVDDLSDKTLCSYDKALHPNRKCIDRRCSKTSEWYSLLLSEHGEETVEYDEWSIVKESKLFKVKVQEKPQQKQVKSLLLVTKKIVLHTLIDQLRSAVKLFSGHLFRAKWQNNQYKISKEKMPGKSAVLVADFAENFACSMAE